MPVESRTVTVSMGDLPRNAGTFVDAVDTAATAGEARNVTIDASHDGTELTVGFTVDAVDDDAAKQVGYAVIDAVEADLTWSVAVLTNFVAEPDAPQRC